jgi:hypothetical protein
VGVTLFEFLNGFAKAHFACEVGEEEGWCGYQGEAIGYRVGEGEDHYRAGGATCV